MEFQEFLKNNNVFDKIHDEVWDIDKVVGKVVHICDYRLNDKGDLKPIRAIKPTKVEITDTEVIDKRIYYSSVCFVPVGKKANKTNVIVPFDTTGFRSYPGVAVKVFNDEQECITFYNKQIDEAQDKFREKIKSIEDKINEMENLKI